MFVRNHGLFSDSTLVEGAKQTLYNQKLRYNEGHNHFRCKFPQDSGRNQLSHNQSIKPFHPFQNKLLLALKNKLCIEKIFNNELKI